MTVSFGLLGPLEVLRDGEPVEPGGKKQRAVLAMLLLNVNEVVSTDRLIEALWGDSPPESAPKALQVHVSQLRKALGDAANAERGQILTTRSPGYVLELEPERLDVARFERLARDGRAALESGDVEHAAETLRDALALWRGPPLADFAYDGFAQAEIARLTELRLTTLEDRIETDLARGRHAAAVPELESLVGADPLRERPWGQLMLALYRSRRQADALDAYRRARESLVEELGIEPGKDLRRLHEAILAQDPALDLVAGLPGSAIEEVEPAGGRSEAEDADGAAGFVGRDDELTELGQALQRTRAGHGGLHLIGGEPGIGKSRLADELSRRAQGEGACVLWGRCWEAGGAPAYWPWVQALRAYVSSTDDAPLRSQLGTRGGEVAHLLPEIRERLPELPVPASPDSEGARFRLFEAVGTFLSTAAKERPIVLVLDDLHAADTPSLLMLRFIAGEIGDSPILIVGTYRDVEVGPDHPLDATLNDVTRRQASHVLALGGLDEPQVARLIESSIGSAPSRKAAAAIHRGTAGNPLFVGELVRLLVTEDRLEDAAGDPGARHGVPRGLHEVIERRLENVTDDCRRALGVAAVLGRDFQLDALAEVTQRSVDELLDVLDEAISQRIVAEVSGLPGQLRFSHVLIRDVLYDELGAARRRRLHARAGEALEALHAADPDPHLAELAYHFFEAAPTGDPDKAVEYAREAGAHASGQLAYEEAARLYELGIRILRSAMPADEQTRCALTLAVADARLRAGDEDEAKTTFLTAAEIARRLEDTEALAQAALGYGGLLVWPAARGDQDLIPLLEEALESLPESDSALRAKLMARLSCAVRDQPDRERGLPLCEQAVEIAKRLHDQRTLCYSLGALCVLTTDPDSLESLALRAREVIRVAEGIDELELAFTGHLYHSASLFQTGDVEGTRRAIRALSRHGEDLRMPPSYLWGSAELEAALALFEGRFDAAGDLIEHAYDTGRHAQRFNATSAYELQRFLLHRELGGLEGCEESLREVADRWPTYRILRCALASLYVELGRGDDGEAILRELASADFQQIYFDEEFLASMTLLAEVCSSVGDAECAALLYERLLPYEGLNAFGMVEIALGAVARPLGLLAHALNRSEAAAGHLESAIAMNEAMGARPWVAHTRFNLGLMLGDSTDRAAADRALALLTEAQNEYRVLGMHPWISRAERALDQLTPRIA